MNLEQSSCRLLHCPLGSKRQWVLLGIGQLVLLKSTCQYQKAGPPVTCSGTGPSRLPPTPMVIRWSQGCCQNYLQWDQSLSLNRIVIDRVSVSTPLCCSVLHPSDLQEQFFCSSTSAAQHASGSSVVSGHAPSSPAATLVFDTPWEALLLEGTGNNSRVEPAT